MVKKKDGNWRPCGDFRRLNLITSEDRYPVTNMNDFSAQLAGCTVFSTLDLKNGYLQIPLHPAGVPKTAINTPVWVIRIFVDAVSPKKCWHVLSAADGSSHCGLAQGRR